VVTNLTPKSTFYWLYGFCTVFTVHLVKFDYSPPSPIARIHRHSAGMKKEALWMLVDFLVNLAMAILLLGIGFVLGRWW